MRRKRRENNRDFDTIFEMRSSEYFKTPPEVMAIREALRRLRSL